ncbi:uncharacterized protein ddias [Pagrus major]|uniref:uncharacterized protein ddias n=1 Tax=Pagrus major TaxID=143350 RepID=UPI003CC8AFAC
MSVRRALVDCVVLSVQDARLFYPCCRGCLSRIDVERQDTTRCRCSRCGYSCLRDQVDHRYRLSLKVARDRCIFGVTVFGACLNPFFGIHASGLQRLVEDLDGPVEASTRSTLLLKSVEDCFIGRHFIFGLKLPETESGPWLRGPVGNGSSTKDTPHFIASQMILPKATGLGGCTVVSYYQILLQKAASTDPSKTSGPPATTLLLLARQSPARSFNDGTLCASGLFSQSLLRSQDGTLTPTPPWQQSLGLVTSSAEQEEGCSSQDSGDDNSRQTDNFKTPHCAQTVCLEDHKVTEEKVLSPVLSLECSSYNHPFAKYPHPSIEEAVGKSPTLNTWFSPSPPGHNSSKGKCFSTRQVNKTFLASSLAWEDLPFSESLTEFLCEENKDSDIVCETKQHLNVQNHKETAKNNLEIRSQDKNLSVNSTTVRHTNTAITDSNSQMLPDITYSPAPNGGGRHDLSEQVCKNPVGCLNKSQARNICLHECNQEDEKASLPSFENEEEQLEGDAYDCSADLFSSSLMTDMNSNTLTTQEETVRTNTEVCPVRSTPDNQRPKHNKCNRDSLMPLGTQDLDFIPPSQSTPIVKGAVVSRSPASLHRNLSLGQDSCAFSRNLPELDSKKAAKNTTPLSRFICVGANQLSHGDRESTKENQVWRTTSSKHRFTPKRRFRKPEKHKIHMLAQQHPRVQREALKTASTGGINHKCDSSACDVTVCEYEDSEEIIVPPTPAVTAQQSVKLRRRRLTDDGSSTLGFTWEGQQGGGVKCKRTLLDQTLTSSQRDLVQTGNGDSETVVKRSLDASNCYLLDDENEACDWSRDLFSDSV